MANTDFFDCNNIHLTDEQIASMLLTKDADDNWAVRAMFIDAGSSNAIDCNNNTLRLPAMLRKCIGLDENDKPAIRIANKKAAAVNNLEEYANDGAAATGGVPVGGIYWNTTTTALHTRMS